MPVDKVNQSSKINTTSPLDITWKRLISDAQREIKTHKDVIGRLRKSIDFFEKQESLGIEFPRICDKT